MGSQSRLAWVCLQQSGRFLPGDLEKRPTQSTGYRSSNETHIGQWDRETIHQRQMELAQRPADCRATEEQPRPLTESDGLTTVANTNFPIVAGDDACSTE